VLVAQQGVPAQGFLAEAGACRGSRTQEACQHDQAERGGEASPQGDQRLTGHLYASARAGRDSRDRVLRAGPSGATTPRDQSASAVRAVRTVRATLGGPHGGGWAGSALPRPDSDSLLGGHRGGGLLDAHGHRSRLRHVEGVAAGHLDHGGTGPVRMWPAAPAGEYPIPGRHQVPARLGPPGGRC
jgi:hypothetical protein